MWLKIPFNFPPEFSILDLKTINMKVKNLRASLVAQW